MDNQPPQPAPAPPVPPPGAADAAMETNRLHHRPPSPRAGSDDSKEGQPLPGSVQALVATEITDNRVIPVDPDRLRSLSASSGETPDLKSPLLGDFRLLNKLGEGAMGTVYKAQELSADRLVAVKVLFPHMARHPRLLERFYREARLMGRLDHPHLVNGYAVGEDQGWHYFAMEYVDGRSLQKWLTMLGKLPIGDALHVSLACASALQYVHELAFVHRDIKPDTVQITRAGTV